jgi:hypothetical protein
MEIIRKDSSTDSSSDSGDEVFWDFNESPPSTSPIKTFQMKPIHRPPSPPPPVTASAPLKENLYTHITKKFDNLSNGITRATSLDPSTRQVYDYRGGYYKSNQLWEYEDEDGFKYALNKYKLDQLICQIAQKGLSYAHTDPMGFTFKSCLEWKTELEEDYLKKNGNKYQYEPIEINDEIKNKISQTKEYKILIQIASKVKSSNVA